MPLSKQGHSSAHLCARTQGLCVQECNVMYVRTKQLQLPAWEGKLPVASLQTAAGQPRYQPISSVEAECRKLAWLPVGAKLSNIMRQHDKFIWGYEGRGKSCNTPTSLSVSVTFDLSIFLWLQRFSSYCCWCCSLAFLKKFIHSFFLCELICHFVPKLSDMTWQGLVQRELGAAYPGIVRGNVGRVCSCSLFTRGTKAPS